MKRIQLFEFEDFKWFPHILRTSITKLIVVFHKMIGTREVIADLISKIRQENHFSQIIDLGSGSGGAMIDVANDLNETDPNNPLKLLLTDLHPNPSFVQTINNQGNEYITYSEASVDATDLSQTGEGLKTMMNSFHHMPPTQAKKILASAQNNRQPILIYEMGENNIPTLIWWLFLPISLTILIVMVLFMTPFVRPLTWQQILFTYLLPIIPLTYAWDGQASLVRMYTFKDIDQLLPPPVKDYEWEMNQASKRHGKKLGYYILGLPKKD